MDRYTDDLFDSTILFRLLSNTSELIATYHARTKDRAKNNLDNIYAAVYNICTRQNTKNLNYRYLKFAITHFKQLVFKPYTLEQVYTAASILAYTSKIIDSAQVEFWKFNDRTAVSNIIIEDDKLQKLKRNNVEAYWYWGLLMVRKRARWAGVN